MGYFLLGCAALMAAGAGFRLGFRLWAENPRAPVPRTGGGRLTVYEVAVLRAWRLRPDRLAETVVTAMVLSGTVRKDQNLRLRVVPGVRTADAVQAAVLAELGARRVYSPQELVERVARTEGVRAVEREARAAGLLTRSESEAPEGVWIATMWLTGVLGFFGAVPSRSLPVAGFFVLLLAAGASVPWLAPVRYDRASRRGRRLLREATGEPGPVLPPGLELDGAARAELVSRAHYGLTRAGGLSFQYASGGGPRGAEERPVLGEGPGLGGL